MHQPGGAAGTQVAAAELGEAEVVVRHEQRARVDAEGVVAAAVEDRVAERVERGHRGAQRASDPAWTTGAGSLTPARRDVNPAGGVRRTGRTWSRSGSR